MVNSMNNNTLDQHSARTKIVRIPVKLVRLEEISSESGSGCYTYIMLGPEAIHDSTMRVQQVAVMFDE